MSESDDRLLGDGPFPGEPGSEHDPERAEAYADTVGADPTQEQIDNYLELEGEPTLAEQADDDSDEGDADG
jgi:hypothetical protein